MANEYEGFEELKRQEIIESRRIASSYQGADQSDDWWLRNLQDMCCEQGDC